MNNTSYIVNILEYSQLPPSQLSLETFQGVVINTLLDKQIFNKNSELPDFVENVLKMKFREYVYDSRTLLIARVIREINIYKKDELHALKVRFFEHFKEMYNINDKSDLSKWLKGLGNN